MSDPSPIRYEFGAFSVDAAEKLLSCRGETVPLTLKAFETLLVLVESRGRVVDKTKLMQRVWADSFVEENNLAQNISHLRKTLQQCGGEEAAKYIETIPKRGYRFNAQVIASRDDATAATGGHSGPAAEPLSSFDLARVTQNSPTKDADAWPAPHIPETRYARSGDVNIAYQVLGDAPLDLVFVMGWVSHLEYFWTEPSFARFLRHLASFSRLILFDKRGTGLSDRVPLDRLPTLEERMDDVRAVLDAVGSERAAILGISEGGPMSALFAATYPEKTSALVMIGTYAKRIWAPDYPWAPTPEGREQFFREMQNCWGGPVGIEERAPSKVADAQFREWWATYLRMGASPGAAVALTRMNAEIDVRNVLPTVRVPALVLHRAGDRCLKVEEGRYVAEKIPGATFVELPGEDHLPFVGDQNAMLDEIEEFLTGVRHQQEPDRVLATVLSLDIDHTPANAGGGSPDEARRRDLFARLRSHVGKEIVRFRGREVNAPGPGEPLATFDGPVRAIRCACAIKEYAARLGVGIGAGLHTGECDMLNGNGVGGVAVEIGRQIRKKAESGVVLVSSTVKDLVAGSGIRFADAGTHKLADVADEWRLFRVES